VIRLQDSPRQWLSPTGTYLLAEAENGLDEEGAGYPVGADAGSVSEALTDLVAPHAEVVLEFGSRPHVSEISRSVSASRSLPTRSLSCHTAADHGSHV
jgi:hypothetical protein